MEDEIRDQVRVAVQDLNEILGAAHEMGYAVEVWDVAQETLGDRHPRIRVQVSLWKETDRETFG